MSKCRKIGINIQSRFIFEAKGDLTTGDVKVAAAGVVERLVVGTKEDDHF